MEATSLPQELPELLPRLRAVVARHARSQDVDDLTQECCVRIVEKEHLWSGASGSLGGWLAAVARSVTLNRRRRAAARPVEALEQGAEPSAEEDPDMEDRVGWILQQLSRLPEEEREVLHLRYYEGKTVSEVGTQLGLSQPAASRRIARAVESLRQRARFQGLLSAFLPLSWSAQLAPHLAKMKLALLAGGLAAAASSNLFLPDPDTHLVGDVDALAATEVVAGLDAPLDPRTNQLWAASMALAWNELVDLAGGPLVLDPQPTTASLLNTSGIGREVFDPERAVIASGYPRDGLLESIESELQRKFGQGPDPVLRERLQGVPGSDLVAYAFLAQSLRWPVPFDSLEAPLRFAFDEGGERKQAAVQSFGVAALSQNEDRHGALRDQVRVHHYASRADWVLQLGTGSEGDHVVLARIQPGSSLRATWENVVARLTPEAERLNWEEELRLPKLDLHLTKRYAELCGPALRNARFGGATIQEAIQDVRFRMDEKGAEFMSRGTLRVRELGMGERELVCDGAFLVGLVRPGQSTPYFLAWIAHPEALIPME